MNNRMFRRKAAGPSHVITQDEKRGTADRDGEGGPSVKDSHVFGREIGQCENLEEYEKLVRAHGMMYVGWREHIVPLLRRNGLNAQNIAEGCHVSRNCAKNFIQSIPARRESVIMLSLMMGQSVDEANELLTRWAKFQRLYPKYPDDFIWIYLLGRGKSMRPYDLFHAYYDAYELIRKKRRRKSAKEGALETKVVLNRLEQAARDLPAGGDEHERASVEELRELARNDARFAELTRQFLSSFEQGYQKLMDYIESLFSDIEREDNLALGLEELNRRPGLKKNTPNVVFKGKWLSMYYQKMRDLKTKHKVPSRAFLIALGLRMSMDTDSINQLLEMAGMGSLCPKDRMEGTIVFYLEELYCQFPSLFLPSNLEIDNLMDYEPQEGSLPPDYMKLDAEFYPKETLSEYIKRRLEETNLFENDDEREAVRKFLKLL